MESDNLSINVNGELKNFSTPWVMGIVNVTPDSFYAGSRTPDREAIKKRITLLKDTGADLLDIGGYSTRPGADEVTAAEEYRRVSLALECVRECWPEAIVSIDTFRADVARKCVEEWRVGIINDISGGDIDAEMFDTVADTGAAYVLMHTRGTPSTMQYETDYGDVTAEVISDLAFKAARLQQMGVRDIIIDPGFGFAKELNQNYEMLSCLDDFKSMGYPLLVGISRKSMIYRLLNISSEDSLNGTTVLNTYALMHGADILRVHDVEAAVQAVKLTQKLKQLSKNVNN